MSQLYKKIEYGVILIILHSSLAIRSMENNFNEWTWITFGLAIFFAVKFIMVRSAFK